MRVSRGPANARSIGQPGVAGEVSRTIAVTMSDDMRVTEAVNLANARGGAHVALRILELIDRSAGMRLEWIGALRFEETKAYFRKHADHGYSFTDCSSFVLMRELKLTDALSTDRHFQQAGFRVLPAAPRRAQADPHSNTACKTKSRKNAPRCNAP